MTIAALSCYAHKNHLQEGKKMDKAWKGQFLNVAVGAAFVDLALITALVIGFLGATGVIHMPSAAYYTLIALGGTTLVADAATAVHNLHFIHKLHNKAYKNQ